MARPESRYDVDFPIYLSWQDRQGAIRRASGRCVDISASGAHIRTTDALPRHILVLVQSDKFGRMGQATVRYCRRSGMRYEVGLHFSLPLALGDGLRKQILEKASESAENQL